MVVTHRVARTLALTLVLSLATAGSAMAATKNGITPVAPKAGTSVPAGKGLSFRMKVADPGSGVFVRVCKSKKRNAKGLICRKASFLSASKRNGKYVAKQQFFDFPSFWLNRPGTYYWQASAINCINGTRDCEQEGPVVRFRVK